MNDLEIPYSSDETFDLYRTKDEGYWREVGERRTLALFARAAREVPAYADFLKKHGIEPSRIRTWADFQQVPVTDKANYLRQYPLEDLSWGGTLLGKPLDFAATSGSTGTPFYFPRSEQLEWQCSTILEMFLRHSSFQSRGPVAVINAFAMGPWMGGMMTYKAFDLINQRGKQPVSVLCTSNNKPAIFEALRHWATHFPELVLCGYPPLIKDVVDEGAREGIDWQRFHLRFHFAAEAFSEDFRHYVAKAACLKNLLLDTMSIYGSADLGAMAFETPWAILMRELITEDASLSDVLFKGKTATLAQFNPFFVQFEAPGGTVLVSGNNTIPLIRYSLGDVGGVLGFSELTRALDRQGVAWKGRIQEAGLESYRYELPFVYVHERSDFAVSLCGAKIFPETIRKILIQESFQRFCTGKFTLLVSHDEKQNPHLEVHVECKRGGTAAEKQELDLQQAIVAALLRENAEYRSAYEQMREKALPKLVFWPFEHPLHFGPHAKHKWIK